MRQQAAYNPSLCTISDPAAYLTAGWYMIVTVRGVSFHIASKRAQVQNAPYGETWTLCPIIGTALNSESPNCCVYGSLTAVVP